MKKKKSPLGQSLAVGGIFTSDSPSKPGQKNHLRDIGIILAVSWSVRLLFMMFVPPRAHCFDAYGWESVANALNAGMNPYEGLTVLNWPPFWMQLIFCISKTAAILGVPFFRALQIFLIIIESAVIIQVCGLIRDIAPEANVRKIVLLGIALNPIAILLVCQHCNFDVIVGLWLVLFARSLVKYHRTRDIGCWLSACLFLGLGILTKTVPLVLIPMLAGGFRQVTPMNRFVGSFLLLAPVTLGMSIIFVLSPDEVTSNVLLYRSSGTISFYGIPEIFHLLGAERFLFVHNLIFYGLLATAMGVTWNAYWRGRVGEKETVLWAAIVLAAIPTLGPGWGPQYTYWFLPLFVATWPFFNRSWRAFLIVALLTIACLYIIEYALLPEFGYSLAYLLGHSTGLSSINQPPPVSSFMANIFFKADSEFWRTLFRLPMFIIDLALLIFGGLILKRIIPDLLNWRGLKVFYSLIAFIVLGSVIGASLKGQSTPPMKPAMLDTSKDNMETTIALNNLAWELATSADPGVRDGRLAVVLAKRACAQMNYTSPITEATLAAAYAEAGQYPDAIIAAQQACTMASSLKNPEILNKNKQLLLLFQEGQPYHETTNSN